MTAWANIVEVSSVVIETNLLISSWNSSLTDVEDSKLSMPWVLLFKIMIYFFRAVLSSQKNWGEDIEKSHTPLPPQIPLLCRVVHFVTVCEPMLTPHSHPKSGITVQSTLWIWMNAWHIYIAPWKESYDSPRQQGSNLWSLHWQADSYPLYHQGKPQKFKFLMKSSLLVTFFM